MWMLVGEKHSKRDFFKSPVMMWLTLVAVLLLAGCEQSSSPPRSQVDRHTDKIAANRGVYYRVQASYEVIETGEPIDFDYVVSCYNGDLPGSFMGVMGVESMFLPTKTGQAIGIAVPEYVCNRALRGEALIKPKDMWKMPILSWYPDVNNLSYYIKYASNDVYTSPRAQVRFVSYDVSYSNAREYVSWYELTQKEYVQIGQIPGPFGCNYTTSDKDDSCLVLARNSGHKRYALPDTSTRHIKVLEWPDGYTEDVAQYLDVEQRYFCTSSWDYEIDAISTRRIGDYIDPRTRKIPSPQRIQELHKHIWRIKQSRTHVYLDPELLLNGIGDRQVRAVYPIFEFDIPLELVSSGREFKLAKAVNSDDWKGFAIRSNELPSGRFFPEIDPPVYIYSPISLEKKKIAYALFLNEDLLCETIINRVEILDLYDGKTLSSNNPGVYNSNW